MRVCISSVALVSKKMFHETLNFGSHWSCELSACIPSTVTLWQKKNVFLRLTKMKDRVAPTAAVRCNYEEQSDLALSLERKQIDRYGKLQVELVVGMTYAMRTEAFSDMYW